MERRVLRDRPGVKLLAVLSDGCATVLRLHVSSAFDDPCRNADVTVRWQSMVGFHAPSNPPNAYGHRWGGKEHDCDLIGKCHNAGSSGGEFDQCDPERIETIWPYLEAAHREGVAEYQKSVLAFEAHACPACLGTGNTR